MRVLIVTYLLRSGVLTHVWDLAQQLENDGMDITVAILRKKPDKKNWFIPVKKYDCSAVLGPIQKMKHFFYDTAEELINICRKHDVQLVHAHSRLVFPSCQIASKTLEIPLVLTLHGVFPWQDVYPSSLEQARAIIAVGPAQTAYTGKAYEKITVIPNGIDTEHFYPLPHRWRQGEPLHILWFGRTNGSSSRGVAVLDHAIAMLRQQNVLMEATLVGRPAGAKVTEFKIMGWVSNPRAILQSGHLAFGHGRALREAMACGNVGFLLGHGYGGQVEASWFDGDEPRPVSAIPEYDLPVPDANRIAQDILRFYENEWLLHEARLEARNIASKHFDVRDMINQVVDVYQTCFNDEKRG